MNYPETLNPNALASRINRSFTRNIPLPPDELDSILENADVNKPKTVLTMKDYKVPELKQLLKGSRQSTKGTKAQLYFRWLDVVNGKKSNQPLNKKPTTEEEYKTYTIKELKDILKKIGLPVSGSKQNLINRLRAFEEIDFEYVAPVKKPSKNTTYDFRMLSDMILPNIKRMAKHYGVNTTGKKQILIDRIISHVKDKGFDLDSELPSKPVPKRDSSDAPLRDVDIVRLQVPLKNPVVAELKLLRKEYNKKHFPIEESIPSTIPVDKNINITRKKPEQPKQQLVTQKKIIDKLLDIVPLDVVKNKIDNYKKNKIIFQSNIIPRISEETFNKWVNTFIIGTDIYDIPRWDRTIKIHNGKYAMVYNRIISIQAIYDKMDINVIKNFFEKNKKHYDDVFSIMFIIPEYKNCIIITPPEYTTNKTVQSQAQKYARNINYLIQELHNKWSIRATNRKNSKIIWEPKEMGTGNGPCGISYRNLNSVNYNFLEFNIVDKQIEEIK